MSGDRQGRCPACAAALRPGAPWCTLCYADLRPPPATPRTPPAAPAPPVVVPPAAAYGLPALDPLTAPAAALGLPDRAPMVATWPCAACGAANALAADACVACGAGFLAALRLADGPVLELPVVGDLGRLSRGQRLGAAAGLVSVLLLLVALLGVLTG